ncbi:uncharacterized protein LOC129779265 isoform X2 [Toxorhynchites rutilus septentrionalis]|uniref:uncharacterized protein LOC129762592 isoform X2 n=2 Tax=Toxorhynchites rutilus septentrionalis TaxID=329112 RepID=UPI00247A6F6C|nr:uncharacterized protein LOC129762592 isoform X2 [Toxorhynchites rutilus septentrionalis]XP_055617140.1 uncharacterized protein LOC129762678 isoform X2 [Toxorhynchites rutilus septentrionalis]XP_055617197.1 uncharacterized protein LOC129762705 isoform X2 [Toxorhynchites rutilus septentrionalis]XP_055617254.1 uncharacterized protein LOC129762759 isoform X1 [Toxorhynchites rutilus septentrionalis]XP_055617398.1 uncharacterized protein LOC129762857 isoform X2 [Toxorhynchites rutilus septentriona
MTQRWNSEQNEHFVELYKEQTILWNCMDPNYKNRDLRKASLEYIRSEVGLSDTKEVTKKIKNLRSTYNQEKLKIEKSKRSGCGTDEIYKPSVQWFDAMDYIMNIIHLKEKQTISNLEPFHASTSGSDFAEEITIIDEEYLDATDENNADEILPKKPSNRRSKKKLSTEQSTIQAAVNELKELNNNLTVSASSMGEPEDECEAIGRHVIMQLRQYRKNALCVSRMQYTYSDHEYTETSQATVGFPPRSP